MMDKGYRSMLAVARHLLPPGAMALYPITRGFRAITRRWRPPHRLDAPAPARWRRLPWSIRRAERFLLPDIASGRGLDRRHAGLYALLHDLPHERRRPGLPAGSAGTVRPERQSQVADVELRPRAGHAIGLEPLCARPRGQGRHLAIRHGRPDDATCLHARPVRHRRAARRLGRLFAQCGACS